MIELTSQEQEALTALKAASERNGHDFGLLEDVVWAGDRQVLGALVTNLVKKDVITDIDHVDVNGGPKRGGQRYTQYVLNPQFIGG